MKKTGITIKIGLNGYSVQAEVLGETFSMTREVRDGGRIRVKYGTLENLEIISKMLDDDALLNLVSALRDERQAALNKQDKPKLHSNLKFKAPSKKSFDGGEKRQWDDQR